MVKNIKNYFVIGFFILLVSIIFGSGVFVGRKLCNSTHPGMATDTEIHEDFDRTIGRLDGEIGNIDTYVGELTDTTGRITETIDSSIVGLEDSIQGLGNVISDSGEIGSILGGIGTDLTQIREASRGLAELVGLEDQGERTPEEISK